MKPTERDAAASAEAGVEAKPRRSSDKPLFKRKGPKGPNPLSVKKKSTKHKASMAAVPPAAAAAVAAAASGAGDGAASKGGRPRRRGKGSQPIGPAEPS